ncbi:hypothetical protein E2N92_03585 [Methanofollis formosanus]|uniref:Uncharacterized protein n=1 Tax=Methanofollis formosanus TaxID=299308 RepID=A0A8G0ZYJ5_9EURY|nr:hypothetical protein [Methanofollis formosanus]QYZ78574.1 hypothetical protein E2N92_03585 [Methanofollis formosanus]
MAGVSRPLGVTIVGLLYLFLGILGLLAGITVFMAGTALEVAGVGAFAGGIVILVALVNLAIGLGCFKGWGWVWTVAVLFSFINILIALYNWWVAGHTMAGLTTALVSIIIPVIILWYLFKDNVKAFFGKT